MTRLPAKLMLFATLTLLAACAVVETRDLVSRRGTGPDAPAFACRSTAGEYGLPLSTVTISVEENRNSANPSVGDPTSTVLQPLKIRSVRDKRQTFCLDFLNAFNSADELKIDKDPATGLLKSVSINTVDELPQVFDAIEAFATSPLTRSATAAKRGPIKFVDEFDPMRPDDIAIMNARLRDFGFCVLVNVHGQPAESLDAQVKKSCMRAPSSRELTTLVHQTAANETGFQVLPEDYKNSILYRPTVTADIYIMRQFNRQRPNRWDIYEKQVATLIDSNAIHGLDIKRAVFAKRKTDLTFKEGVLTTVVIDKGSELGGFIGIPLSIVRSIVRLPTEIIKVQIGRQNELANLIEAQSSLIDAERSLAEQREATTGAATTLAAARSSNNLLGLGSGTINQCVATCQALGTDGPSCQTSCACRITNCQPGDTACARACGP